MSRNEKMVLAVVIFLFGSAIYTQFKAAYLGDKDWLLLATQMWLSGRKMYAEIFETNPPLIVWLYTLPAYLSIKLAHVKSYQILFMLGMGIAAFSVFISTKIMQFHQEFATNTKRGWWHIILLWLILVADINPGIIFDRDHFFLLLVFPYLLRSMPSLFDAALNRKLKMVIGCMAGIGFCIKPHCAIVFIGIQVLRFIRTPRIAVFFYIENMCVYAIAIIYIFCVFVFMPEYITIMIPMVYSTYFIDSKRINALFFTVEGLVMLGVAFADFKWSAKSNYRRDIYYLLSLSPIFLLYAFANNGWGYTYNPFITIILILTGWIGLEAQWLKEDAEQKGLPNRQFVFGTRACGLSLVTIIGGSILFNLATVTMGCTEHIRCTHAGRELMATMSKVHSFGTLSANNDNWVGLVEATGASWETPLTLWMLPKFFISGEKFLHEHHAIVEYVANTLADDISHRKPEIMFVDNMDVLFMTPIYVDLVAYFSIFPHFRESWSHYQHIKTINTCPHPEKKHCSFEVYRREP